MPSPDPPTLQGLDRLDRSSPEFHNQLSNTLYGEEYQQCVPNLRDDDLVWLIVYLDKVRHHEIIFPTPRSSQRRRSATSNLRAPLPGSVYASSGGYVQLGGYSRPRTRFRLIF